MDNSIVAAVIKERYVLFERFWCESKLHRFSDELREKYEQLQIETTELQETAVEKAREQLRQTPEPDDGQLILKQRLDDQQAVISALEEEIKRLEKSKMTTSNNVSESEIKLLATEEDLEATKILLKKEEAKTSKQQLQVKMLKERLMKENVSNEKWKNCIKTNDFFYKLNYTPRQ